jgi:hypothetical protein
MACVGIDVHKKQSQTGDTRLSLVLDRSCRME